VAALAALAGPVNRPQLLGGGRILAAPVPAPADRHLLT
jgi:hypothetical protein